MPQNLTATTQITVHASTTKVWDALTKPELIKKYLMGANVHTDWRVGSPIVYTGEYEGKPYEEKGVIQQFEPRKLLQASGKEDRPENYARVTWNLHEHEGATVVTVSQDKLPNEKGVESTRPTGPPC